MVTVDESAPQDLSHLHPSAQPVARRDLRHLVNIVHELTERGVGLKVLTGQGAAIDTTIASGKPYKMTPAKVRLAMASMGQPGTKVGELCAELGVTRQTLYRHVSPTGELRADGKKLLTPK